MPRGERAATALDAKDAPTHAQVSTKDADASTGRALATRPGIRRLHSRPAAVHFLLLPQQQLERLCVQAMQPVLMVQPR